LVAKGTMSKLIEKLNQKGPSPKSEKQKKILIIILFEKVLFY